MAAHSVGLNENDTIAAALLSSRIPWTEAERVQLREQTAKVQEMLRNAGVTEEELFEDFKRLHNAERKVPR